MIRFVACAFAATLCLLVSPLAALADSIDASTVTCQELTEKSQDDDKDSAYGASVILYWMAGYHTTDEQGTVVDFDNLIKEFGQTADFCAKNPAIGVMTASAKFMGANAAAATGKAIDLSIIKCEHANATKPEETDGLGQILMWLSGYHKSTNESTILDLDEFSKSVEKIAEFCTQNPQVGLYTASEKFMGEGDDSDDSSESSDDSSKE